ncbi:transposable element Tcb1 transposase [Trichonephila clavipes]|nr:transposable element Tcb1 transposase [Trichonephila clavipes]
MKSGHSLPQVNLSVQDGTQGGSHKTSGSDRCHLHEGQAYDALDRPVTEKITTSYEMHAYSQLLHRLPFSHSDESTFNLSSDDNRVRVWRPRCERLIPVFALQRHTAPTAVLMVWGAIAYNTRSLLILIRGAMTAQRYVHDILEPYVLPLM